MNLAGTINAVIVRTHKAKVAGVGVVINIRALMVRTRQTSAGITVFGIIPTAGNIRAVHAGSTEALIFSTTYGSIGFLWIGACTCDCVTRASLMTFI